MNAIRTERLGKRFGRTLAVDDLTLTVRPGEVFGFLGPNGAGKSTTVRLLLGLLRPSSGRAWLFGDDAARRRGRAPPRRLRARRRRALAVAHRRGDPRAARGPRSGD